VVSGRRSALGHDELASVAPAVWQALLELVGLLERNFGDMQDFEFTVQHGQLYLLQTRNGKRTPLAAARIALDLMDEGVIDAGTAARRTHGLDAAALTQRHVAASDGTSIDPVARTLTLAGRLLHEGALVTLDGNEGTIYLGATKIVESVPQEILTRLEGLRCGQSMASGG
jgi:pyruvate,orthophosphate dikinase